VINVILSFDTPLAVDFVVCMHFHANTSYVFFAELENHTVFGLMISFILVGEYKRFGGTKCLCLQNENAVSPKCRYRLPSTRVYNSEDKYMKFLQMKTPT